MPTTAMFESWRGRYADSPRAISEGLRVRRPDIRQVWVASEDTVLPDGVERLQRHSASYFFQLLRTDLLVCNDIISRHVVKGPRVQYLQTWHGTPLKAIGYDEVDPHYSGAEAHLKRMRRDIAKWDQLLSPSPVCSELFRGAFRFEGEIIESGYPRNDMLCAADREQVGAQVRAHLGIGSDRTVVLYAPTWRDDVRSESGGFADPGELDIADFLARCGEEVVLLMRMHSVVQTRTESVDPRVIDVSAYPEISELYLAADMLVSDYSSAVYDFAVTRKPIVLFAYDLDHYRTMRPFYFEYASWAPGPVVANTADLAAAVTDAARPSSASMDAWPSEHYKAFVEKFCPLDDGRSTDRALDAILTRLSR